MFFPEQNSTNLPLSILNNLTHISDEYSANKKKEYLKYHQYIVYKYLITNEKARGLLLFHDMGMGKSIIAVALAEYYKKHDPSRKIIILLSKSLQENFKKNIIKYIKDNESDKETQKETLEKELDSYQFISLNASNMYTQLSRVDKSYEELVLENQLKDLIEITEQKDFLENSLLIIDEFHNLSNGISNGSMNAIKIYDKIMSTKNIKLLFLTGTPIINNPFELVPTFNMLKGRIEIATDSSNKKSHTEYTTLFPENKKDFDLYFIDHKYKIKNASKFQNRIFGLCSYYGGLYFGKKKMEGFESIL